VYVTVMLLWLGRVYDRSTQGNRMRVQAIKTLGITSDLPSLLTPVRIYCTERGKVRGDEVSLATSKHQYLKT